MSKPDAQAHYNPCPDYLRRLIKKAGLTQKQAAEKVGVNPRTLQDYIAPRTAKSATTAPYSVQFVLEKLAE